MVKACPTQLDTELIRGIGDLLDLKWSKGIIKGEGGATALVGLGVDEIFSVSRVSLSLSVLLVRPPLDSVDPDQSRGGGGGD